MSDRERLFDELRPVSFAIAYRMLGSVAEAEDIVQEALLRVHRRLEDGNPIQLLGDRSWWLPRWLDRIIPKATLEGSVPAPAPAR